MKNYLCQKTNMLQTLAICAVLGVVFSAAAIAQTTPPPNKDLYWYVVKENDNATIGNSINGTSTLGFQPKGWKVTDHTDFVASKWTRSGMGELFYNPAYGGYYEIIPDDKGSGLFILGRWGEYNMQQWWSVSIYTKEELSKDIDSIKSIAVNAVGGYPINVGNDNSPNEALDYAVFVYETNENVIRPGNSTVGTSPADCMFLPQIADNSAIMNELWQPVQVENNAFLGNPRNLTDEQVDTYLQDWLDHNAYLIERRNVTFGEFEDNAWIEFSTENEGRPGYEYKGGNLVVVMLQLRRTFPVNLGYNTTTGNQSYMFPNTNTTVHPDFWIRNYGAENRGWHGHLSSFQFPANNYNWNAPSSAQLVNRGAGIFAMRFGVDAIENNYVSALPSDGMAVVQAGANFHPRVYHTEIASDRAYDVAKFSYKIVDAAGVVVYRAKSSASDDDTLINASRQGNYTEINMATGSYAYGDGRFRLSPEANNEPVPPTGDYRAIITWQTFASEGDNKNGAFPTRQLQNYEVPFSIVLPITTVNGTHPTWQSPITLGQALTTQQQPAIVVYAPQDDAYMPTVEYRIHKAQADANGELSEIGELVYTALGTENNEDIAINAPAAGLSTIRFTNARGEYVNAEGLLDNTKLTAGKYYIGVTATYPAVGQTSQDIETDRYDSFWVASPYELEMVSLTAPRTADMANAINSESTFPADVDLKLEYEVKNWGSAVCSTHVFTAEIYNSAGVLFATIKDTNDVPINFATQRVLVSNKTFRFLPTQQGVYSIKSRVDFLDRYSAESETNTADNVYPREGVYYPGSDAQQVRRFFRIQAAYVITIGTQQFPPATAYRYPGYPVTLISNGGSTDINGIDVNLVVEGPGGDTVINETKPLSNVPPFGTPADPNNPSVLRHNTLFVPDRIGTYHFVYSYTLPGASGPTSVTHNLAIKGGLGSPTETTIYTIGQPGEYSTIRQAMEDLYYQGIQGHVIFELDAELNEAEQFVMDASYLDFRSKIVGVGPDATITFRPSPKMMTESKPLILSIDPTVYAGEVDYKNGLRTEDWFGMAFGDASSPRIDVAAVNNVVEPFWKRHFAESNGYITIDGGSRKNFQIEYNGHYVTGDNKWLAAPVYLGSGSNNITIKNCRISEPTPNMHFSYDIPAIYYDDATLVPSGLGDFRYEALSTETTNIANIYTTAGILMFARPVDPIRIDNVLFNFNRNTSNNNTIEGNVITGFGYGVLALGMGAQLDADTIKPMYNKGTKIVGNLIKGSGQSGIFLGFEENAVVSGNRINNIVGSANSVTGIRLGQATDEQRIPDGEDRNSWKLDGTELNLNNYNVLVEKNEIDGIRAIAGQTAFGILITEPTDTLQYFNRQYSPLAQIAALYNNETITTNNLKTATNEVYTITNNLIYDIVASGGSSATVSKAGIAVLTSAAGRGILPDSEYDHTRHKINKVLASNNTIILDDQTFNTGGPWDCSGLYVAGIKIFDVVNYELANNAIAIKIDTAYRYDYITGVALRSPNPKIAPDNINVNYNAYSVFEPIAGSRYNDKAAFVRFFEVDKYGRMLSKGGFAEEYNKLRNWYSWTGADKNSLEYNFINEVEELGSQYFWNSEDGTTTRRMLPESSKRMSLLDKGCYLDYVATDIDGVGRLLLGKYFNIGAIDFASQHSNYDVAVLAISQPVAYLNPNHLYSAEEQIMLPGNRQNQNVQPKAIIKNNGTIHLGSVPVICIIETSEVSPKFTISDTVWTVMPIGEEKEITFFTKLNQNFTPQTYRESGITSVPEQYRSMRNNVSPVYTMRVKFDSSFIQRSGDANVKNDSLSIRARFFSPRSEKSLLISAKWSYRELYAAGTRNGIETDQDVIAGRLNFDTVVAALGYISYPAPADESDPIYYDVLERTAWEPRAVVYDQYSGIIYSDALNDTIDYWEKKPLLDYVAGATINNKRTLIVGSEGLLASNNNTTSLDPFDKELNDNVLRSTNPTIIYQEGALFIRGSQHNHNLDIELVNTGYSAWDDIHAEQIGDRNPAPHYFDVLDTALGRNSVAYYERGTDNIVVLSSRLLDRNMIHSAIDWRHLKDASAFMEGIFGDVGNDINKPTDGLGIELSDFNANANGKRVFVDWTTLSEGGIANFEVQRADVDNNLSSLFSSITSKRAKGVDNVTSNYSIFDENVNFGKVYAYRLKINDLEGKFTYSPVRTVNIEYQNGAQFGDITPNPVTTTADVNFTLAKEANVIVTVTDLTGKEVITLFSGIAGPGVHPLSIDASELATGTYTIIYNIGGNVVKTAMFNIAK